MSTSDIVVSFGLNLASGALIFFMGLRWGLITSYASRELTAFRHIFGRQAVELGSLTIALDVYRDLRLLPVSMQIGLGVGSPQAPGPGGQRFFKTFPDGHSTVFPGAYGDMLGYCSARAAAYLADGVSAVRGISVRVAADTEVASHWEGTFINVGSSASNVKTDDAKHLPENLWLLDDLGEFRFKDGSVITLDDRADKGIILKLPNPRFQGYSVLVCAGLGEWGTSGAAWFLSRHWRQLGHRFGDHAFLVAVSVTPGSDESAHEILSFGEETRFWRMWTWLRSRRPIGGSRPQT